MRKREAWRHGINIHVFLFDMESRHQVSMVGLEGVVVAAPGLCGPSRPFLKHPGEPRASVKMKLRFRPATPGHKRDRGRGRGGGDDSGPGP